MNDRTARPGPSSWVRRSRWPAAGVLLLGLGIRVTPNSAQPVQQACDCRSDFERLVEKLEANYAALPIEYAGVRRTEYERVKARVRERAARAGSAQCVLVLRELTSFFDDGHLFLNENPRPDSTELVRLAGAAEQTSWTEASVRAYLERNAQQLDPVEGIWYATQYRVGIVRDSAKPGRSLVAVLLTEQPGWKIGQVKAEFGTSTAAVRTVRFFAGNHTVRNYTAQLQKNLLLHMPPVTWGREHPVAEAERGLLHATDPRGPTFTQYDARTALLSIPSHSPEQRPRLDSLIARHRAAIEQARLLIIDIRGNEGGSANTTYGLRPFYYDEPLETPIGPRGQPVVLSSPDNRRYFAGWGQSQFVQDLLARIDAQPGALVPFSTDTTGPSIKPAALASGPARVALLMDRHVVSAGETFVLEAMRSPRVTLFGENTGGVIDYANVSIVPLACAERGLGLGYPLIAATRTLPKDGINANGIPPDVRIPAGAEPLQWIVGYYAE